MKKIWLELYESGSRDGEPLYWTFENAAIDNALTRAPEGTETRVLYGWYRRGYFNCKNISAIRAGDGRIYGFVYELPDKGR